MKFPDFTGPDIAVAFRQLLNWCRSTRILGINGIPAKQGPNGSWLTIDIPKSVAAVRATETLPFTIRVTPTSIIASAGTINGDAHAEEANTTMTNSTWYFRAKVIINDSTGVITSTDVLWATSEAANTSTDFYQTIGTVDIVAGVPDSGTIVQNTYGPMLTIVYGTPTDKWGVTIY